MNEQFGKRELRLLQRGDRDTIERWFDAYSDTLYTFIFYRVGKSHSKAVDVVQETLLTALRQIEQYDPEHGSMFVWLAQLSEDHIKKSMGSESRQVPLKKMWAKIEESLLNAYRKIGTEPLPDELIERQETAELVQTTLANIPADYRDVLKEYYYGLKPLKEIADSAEASEADIEATLYSARKVFKVAFLKLCSGFDDAEIAGGRRDG
jgi:RNA polymerase sigma factor (sigma-70 family)